MDILIIGGGGREHALAWKARQSARAGTVFVAPGNAGTAQEPGVVNVDIASDDLDGLLAFAVAHRIGLTIVGPERPLVLGIVDRFQAAGLRCFGPCAQAAQLEGSKAFCKDFLSRHHIPTAHYQSFTDEAAAIAHIRQRGAPIVVKADGLAAGKGVVVAQTEQQAIAAVTSMLAGNAFGEAGHRVVIEEFLDGEEASFIVIADGERALALATSQDHKARDDGDLGPNTGGMGAYSPAPVVTAAIHSRVMDEVIMPTLRGMAAQGSPYRGFLYAGLMIGADGAVRVLEFNCRCGDPETQPIMMRMRCDLVELCDAALDGQLERMAISWDPRPALGVVLAAEGYPDACRQGDVIHGLSVDAGGDSKLFHAATAQVDGRIVTAGGRVLCACALGDDLKDAQQQAYRLAKSVHWPGIRYRTDIGAKAMALPPTIG